MDGTDGTSGGAGFPRRTQISLTPVPHPGADSPAVSPRPGEMWVRESQVTAEELEAANAAVDDTLPPSDTQEPCLNCDTCVELAKQLARNRHEQVQHNLAWNTYDDEDIPPLHKEYERATREDLERLGLVDGDTNLLELEGHPDFHSEVFAKNDPETGERSYVIGFRGTTALIGQGPQNAGQAMGFETAYYRQAENIGTRARASGERVTFVGHSLGGGLAATASGASGLPAQTFNSAGLSRATLERVRFESPDLVRATHVEGEILNSEIQDDALPPDAYGTRRSIPPGPDAPWEAPFLLEYLSPLAAVSNTRRAAVLHYNTEIHDALKEEERVIRREMEGMGC